MKVITLTSSFPTREGGPHSPEFVADLVRQLPALGITPVVLAPHFPGGRFREYRDDVHIYRFPYFFPFRFEQLAYGAGVVFNLHRDFFAFAGIVPFFKAEFFWTLTLTWRERGDIIHTHWLIPQGFIGALCHRIFNIPHIATIHGSDLNLMKRYRLLRYLCRFIVKNSAVITVNSTYLKNQLEEVASESTSKIHIIPMGVDLAKFKNDTKSACLKKNPADHIILSVGRLIDWKSTVYLIEAMPKIVDRIPEAKLVIIGTGPEEYSLMQRVSDLSLGEYVEFLGQVSNTDLNRYYHSADVFVLPSINKSGNTEALGVVLLEAMASGCPVIGSSVGGIPDIITDGETGFLVPEQRPDILAEKIVRILADNELQEKFRRNGLIRVRDLFSWEIISKKFSDVYEQVLEKQPGN